MYINAVILLLILTLGLASLMMQDSRIFQSLPVLGQTPTEDVNTNSRVNNTNSIDTFDADGTITSLAVDTLMGSNTSLGTHTGDLWLLGGNWSFSVDNGNLSSFNTDIVMTRHDGSGRHLHSINMLTDSTGAISRVADSTIALINENYTSFMGNANMTTGDEVRYQDVPIVIYLNNGNALNINPDPIKTENHFKGLPILGIVSSITDVNGQQLRIES